MSVETHPGHTHRDSMSAHARGRAAGKPLGIRRPAHGARGPARVSDLDHPRHGERRGVVENAMAVILPSPRGAEDDERHQADDPDHFAVGEEILDLPGNRGRPPDRRTPWFRRKLQMTRGPKPTSDPFEANGDDPRRRTSARATAFSQHEEQPRQGLLVLVRGLMSRRRWRFQRHRHLKVISWLDLRSPAGGHVHRQ